MINTTSDMGLDIVTHTGASIMQLSYSNFRTFRAKIAELCGLHLYPEMARANNYQGMISSEVKDEVRKLDVPGLYSFLYHSDCEGTVGAKTCLEWVEALEHAMSQLAGMLGPVYKGMNRHDFEDYVYVLIDGLRRAGNRGKSIEFD